MKPDQTTQSPKVSIGRVLRALLIGFFLFLLWTFSPTLIMRFSGVDLSGPPAPDPDPIYIDKAGKRISEPDREIAIGYELAKKNDITTHSACKFMDKAWHSYGCDRWVTERKNFPPHVRQGSWDSGKTTAECIAEVNAYYRPLIEDQQEMGFHHAADSWTRRQWHPELKECKNYDNIRIVKAIHEPTYRLDAILKRVEEQGDGVTEEDRSTVLKDSDLVATFPDHEDKQAYLAKRERFFKIASMKIKPNAPSPSLSSSPCADNGSVLRQGDPCTESLNSAGQSLALNERQEALHLKLDHLAAEGSGLVKKQPPAPEPVEKRPLPPQRDRFVPPMSRAAMQAQQEQIFAQLQAETKRNNARSAATLTGMLDEAKQACGGKLFDYPAVGMSDETFRNCTIHARFGRVTQIVVSEDGNIPLRLYIFPTQRAQKVYAIDGVITAIKP